METNTHKDKTIITTTLPKRTVEVACIGMISIGNAVAKAKCIISRMIEIVEIAMPGPIYTVLCTSVAKTAAHALLI